MTQHRCRIAASQQGRLLIWEITRLCNLYCRHCCTDSGPKIETAAEITTDAALAVCSSFKANAITRVLFSGGEPMLRPDIFAVLQAIPRNGVEMYVASNGTTLNPKLCRMLRHAGVQGLDISLDGADAGINAALRGKRKVFEQSLSAIRTAVEEQLKVRVSSVVHAGNIDTIERLLELLVDAKAHTVVFQPLAPTIGRAGRNPQIRLEVEDRRHARVALIKARERWGKAIEVLDRLDGGRAPAAPLPRNILHIAPNGDVSTCPWAYKSIGVPAIFGNVAHITLTECVARAMEHDQAIRGGCSACDRSSSV